MITFSSITALIGVLLANKDTFMALGGDFVGIFTAARNLVTNDVTMTDAERTAAHAELDALEAQRDALLTELERRDPNS